MPEMTRTTTATNPPPRRPLPMPVRVVLAPAVWLERARGRKRLGLLLVYGLVATVGALLAWRAMSLRDLPDIGDPFDVQEVMSVQVPDDRNAFVPFAKAGERMKALEDENYKKTVALRLPYGPDWSKATPEERRWLARCGEVLDLFEEGADRPDALDVRPEEIAVETPLKTLQELRPLARLALMDASRRMAEGDAAGAWARYRTVLRASRLCGTHGTMIHRLIGSVILKIGAGPMEAWANDPRVGPDLLRRALADVKEARRMSRPNSEMFRIEYLAFLHFLDRPMDWLDRQREQDPVWYRQLPGYFRLTDFLDREPERSRRLGRLTFANWLAACDRPRRTGRRRPGRSSRSTGSAPTPRRRPGPCRPRPWTAGPRRP